MRGYHQPRVVIALADQSPERPMPLQRNVVYAHRPMNITHHEATLNGVNIHYVASGQGPLVVLLHGFPEFWYSWRHQLNALSNAGFRVVAPDMRGYNTSEKPPRVSDYRYQRLLNDVSGLIEDLGAEPAVVVGHDWGGMIAWGFAANRPDLVRGVVAMNAPHPKAYAAAMRSPLQALRSWYMMLFQLPRLPEAMFRRNNYAMLRNLMAHVPLRPGAFSPEDIELYIQAIAQPGALTSAINYYRAMRHSRSASSMFNPPTISAPAMLLWGDRDRYLRSQLASASKRYVPHLRVEHIEASHWVQNDAPDRVNELLLEFLGSLT
jgi:epoxide hydrolase 4